MLSKKNPDSAEKPRPEEYPIVAVMLDRSEVPDWAREFLVSKLAEYKAQILASAVPHPQYDASGEGFALVKWARVQPFIEVRFAGPIPYDYLEPAVPHFKRLKKHKSVQFLPTKAGKEGLPLTYLFFTYRLVGEEWVLQGSRDEEGEYTLDQIRQEVAPLILAPLGPNEPLYGYGPKSERVRIA